MFNTKPGKSIKRDLDMPLKDKKKVVATTPASVGDKVGEGSGESLPVDNAVDNIDLKNIHKGGNRKAEKEEMQQTTVMISLKNLALMDAHHDNHGSSRSWVVNKALTMFFGQDGA